MVACRSSTPNPHLDPTPIISPIPPPSGDEVTERVAQLTASVNKLTADVSLVLSDQQRTVNELRGRIDTMRHRLDAVGQFAEQWAALPYCALPGNLRITAADGREVMGFRQASDVVLGTERTYVDFEAAFRGSSERVQALVRPYVDILSKCDRVIELGCGRGELLQLLAEVGVNTVGIDADSGMLERARAFGFEVVQSDLMDYIMSAPDASVDGIISVEVIEHLDPGSLTQLLSHARRLLRPGGLLILETVNPHNLASYKFFWLDPTHHHPLFPETMLVLAASTGFDDAQIAFLDGSGDLSRDLLTCDRYALVSRLRA